MQEIQSRVARDFYSSGGSHVIFALRDFGIVGVLLSDIAARSFCKLVLNRTVQPKPTILNQNEVARG